jgi:hypothetical protein
MSVRSFSRTENKSGEGFEVGLRMGTSGEEFPMRDRRFLRCGNATETGCLKGCFFEYMSVENKVRITQFKLR